MIALPFSPSRFIVRFCAAALALLAPAVYAAPPWRYAAVGDSYSIGEGATPQESWPALLARHLTERGLPVELVANPSRTGWTTQDALQAEMPIYISARPTFATLQIGVNDWVQGVDAETFRRRLVTLLDRMLEVLPDKKRLLVVNIPDFSATPSGAVYSHGRDVTKGLTEFNQIIREEAEKRQLALVDVFALSQRMATDSTLVARDGLHPSAREYAEWEKIIFPVAYEMLAKP